ncbi:ribosome maturation factor RimP [Deinococcus lacus]|uniref:Ribosome maturation factor RimP n=1 Tax=Deinococcus lacus TaxID=392561 RepID=A0ABW1YBG0_9DEIO
MNAMKTNLQDNLTELSQQLLAPLGYEVLEVQVQNPGRRPTVLVRVDRNDEQPVTVDDLEQVTRAVSAELDAQDPVQGEYRLEIESPGSKRPLTRARHFERMQGLKAKVRSAEHAFTAPIKAVDGELITFGTEGGDVTLRVGEFQSNLAEFPPEHR